MVYERPAAFVYNAPVVQRMVALRGGAVDLLVTPEHEMYVQHVQRNAAVFGKLKAGDLVTEEPFAAVRMLGCAPAGVGHGTSLSGTSFAATLSDEQLGAVMWLYGQRLMGSKGMSEGDLSAAQKRALLNDVAVAAAQVEQALDATRGALSPLVWSDGPSRSAFRQLIEGMRHASAGVALRVDGKSSGDGPRRIVGLSALLRDDIIRACLHAGYAASVDVETGDVVYGEQQQSHW